MAKQKEQVKYNPKLSDVRRADKAKYAVTGNYLYACNAVFIVIGLLMSCVFILGGIFGGVEYVEEDADSVIMFISNAAFMLFFLYACNAILPANKQTQNSSKIDGCLFIYKLFCHMPVTQLTIVKLSFRYFTLMTSVVCSVLTAGNLLVLCTDRFAPVSGHIGFISFMLAVAMVTLHYNGFRQYSKGLSKKASIINAIAIAVFYLLWFGSMMNLFDPVFAHPVVKALGGIPGLAVIAAAYIWVLIYQKTVVEKKAALSSWRDE